MSTYDYDFFVIGGGSGGVRASRIAAQLGAKVGLCEDGRLGGTCVNVGCVPKKFMVYGSHMREDLEDTRSYGFDVEGRIQHDWRRFIENKDKEILRLNGIYERLLKNAGVDILLGRGVFQDAHTVLVDGKPITADKILIAVGGAPYVLPSKGSDLVSTSDDMFTLEKCPERIMVVGGGYIGVEFAGIFKGFGSDVTMLLRGPKILRGFDEEVRDHLAEEMLKKGIDLHTHRVITGIEKCSDTGSLVVSVEGPHKEKFTYRVDKVLGAVGRRPKVTGLGLEDAGVTTSDKGAVLVDEHFRTTVDNIFAVGDVVGRMELTPVALAEGMYVAHHLYGEKRAQLRYELIPTAVFSQPSIGTVGLSEEAAKKKYTTLRVYTSTFRPMKLTLTERQEKTFMKLIVDDKSDVVVGVHMVGPEAGEIIQGIAIALTAGATKAQFDATIGVHPTLAEEFVTMRSATRVVS
ncbi:MAG: glutathione-disulfide reductase [Deltaproteobacteria bacterium]|nr:glutathione-disulfide reductase [Deltaproteobacteria bacterium]